MTLLNNRATLDSLILESMYSELQGMQQRLQSFQTNANQKLRALEGRLLEDVMSKLEVAISSVAKENEADLRLRYKRQKSYLCLRPEH